MSLYLFVFVSFFARSAPEPVNVVVQQAQQQQLAPRVTLTGSLKAQRHAELSVLTEGVITEIYVEAGTEVEKGAAILALDAALVKAEHQASEASLARAKIAALDAKRRVEEAQSLSSKKLFAQTELADRQAVLQSADASLLEAQANHVYQTELLARHQLKAPFSGVIAQRYVDVGEWVSSGQSVFELVSNKQLWLDLYMPQEHFSAVDLKSAVDVSLASQPSKIYRAQVITKVPVVNTANRSFLVRLQLDLDAQLQVGMSASADVVLKPTASDSVVIDRDALLRHPDGGFSVFTVHEGVAKRQTVKVGSRMNGHVEVLEGLQAGQQVVTQGNELLRDEQAVNVVSQTGGN